MTHWLDQDWKPTTSQYGIDIFMTGNALAGDFRVCEVGLGAKVHRASAPKLGPMFVQVVGTLFDLLLEKRELSPISCLLSPVSCLLSPISCLLSPFRSQETGVTYSSNSSLTFSKRSSRSKGLYTTSSGRAKSWKISSRSGSVLRSRAVTRMILFRRS